MALNCPRCLNQELEKRLLAPRDIPIDVCPACTGVWIDKSEIYYFAKDPRDLHAAMAETYKRTTPSRFLCRRCDVQMLEVKFPDPGPLVDVCRKCGGTWFDKGEVDALNVLIERR